MLSTLLASGSGFTTPTVDFHALAPGLVLTATIVVVRAGVLARCSAARGRQIAYSCGAIASALDPVMIVISTRTV